jgi:RNA polymerase sigma factor (sigma-70 family)
LERDGRTWKLVLVLADGIQSLSGPQKKIRPESNRGTNSLQSNDFDPAQQVAAGIRPGSVGSQNLPSIHIAGARAALQRSRSGYFFERKVYKETAPEALRVDGMERGTQEMTDLSTDPVVRWFDTLFRGGTLGGLSDAQLLDRFLAAETASEAAFEVLLGRHGPMVLGVCRRILGDDHAADDAFQATFLVLMRRAEVIRRRESLGPWLHGVARRMALRAKADGRLRREREARAAIDPATAVARSYDLELDRILHAEIDHLPEKYRAPIVLCYLQGRTIAEAASQLGWPDGTVAGRLARARARLRDRLASRDLVAPAVWAAAVVRPELARSTRNAAIQIAAGRAATTVVSAAVARLLEESIRTMTWTRLMIVGAACPLVAAMAFGAVGMSLPATTAEQLDSKSVAPIKRATIPDVPAGERLNRTLQRATQAAAALDDTEERVETLLGLAWAQIKGGDQAGARASLDRAAEAAVALQAEKRCLSRVQLAQARGEAGDRPGGLILLTLAQQDFEMMPSRRSWALKAIAVAQCELGDRDAARATIQALDHAILSPEQRRDGIWTSTLTDLIEAQIAVGDYDEAFRTCIPSLSPGGPNQHFEVALKQQPWMLMELASAAADANSESRKGYPPRSLSPQEHADRLAVVRRAVAAAEELPEVNERRPILAASLAALGAFDEALAVARRIDQKQIRGKTVEATWALWRISLEQTKAGKIEDARRTAREAARVEKAPEAVDGDYTVGQAKVLIAAGDFDSAEKIAETLAPYGRAEILSRIAGQKLRAGDRVRAEPLFRRALDDVERIRKDLPPLRERPQRIPGPVSDASDDPQAQNQSKALALLAMIHARAGDWTAATKALTAIPIEGRQKGVTAFHIAAIRARSGDSDGTLAWAMTLPSSMLRAWGIRGLAFSVYSDRADQY